MDIHKLVGRNLRRIREEKKLSQDELAYRAGIDRTYLSGIERGLRNPTVTVLWQLSEPLGIWPTALLEKTAPVSRSKK
ncbi:MAG TPA: helix-turn-helix transcriptional regulator [Dongiaceae bacterium]|jgi:transcriptional regulator with XRE-family HTH domain|nr:helix-turn-helix transcriptional regulator [Dongiaceae bacterium]